LFLSYAHADASIVEALRKHLAPLHHEGIIDAWHDRDPSIPQKCGGIAYEEW
jgi:hypothetical protein